jgi:hypothetical protein
MMSISDEDVLISQRIQTMRIVLGALVGGCLAFLITAVMLRQGGQMPPPPAIPIFTFVAVGFGFFWTALSFFIPDFFVASERRKMARASERRVNDPQGRLAASDFVKLAGICQMRMIIGAALVEGCVFFFIIAYLLEGAAFDLLGALVLVGILTTRFPTRLGVERWVENQRELLQQERMGA